jgi:hypothetical protein
MAGVMNLCQRLLGPLYDNRDDDNRAVLGNRNFRLYYSRLMVDAACVDISRVNKVACW